MADEGRKNNTEGRTIQVSNGIAYAARNIQPIFGLATGGEVFPSCLPSVMKEVIDSSLYYTGHLLGPSALGAGCSRRGDPRDAHCQSHSTCTGPCTRS